MDTDADIHTALLLPLARIAPGVLPLLRGEGGLLGDVIPVLLSEGVSPRAIAAVLGARVVAGEACVYDARAEIADDNACQDADDPAPEGMAEGEIEEYLSGVAEDALSAADYATPEDGEASYLVEITARITVWTARSGEQMHDASASTVVHPDEPRCADASHDYEAVGVRAHGGGTAGSDQCARCGLVREWNGWAQDPSTGRLIEETTVAYDTQEYDVDAVPEGYSVHRVGGGYPQQQRWIVDALAADFISDEHAEWSDAVAAARSHYYGSE